MQCCSAISVCCNPILTARYTHWTCSSHGAWPWLWLILRFLHPFSAETTFSRAFGRHWGHVFVDAARSSGQSDWALGADSCSVLTSVFVHTGTDLLIKTEVLFSLQRIDLCEKPGWGLWEHPCCFFQPVPAYVFVSGSITRLTAVFSDLRCLLCRTTEMHDWDGCNLTLLRPDHVLMKTHFPNSRLHWTLRFSHIKTNLTDHLKGSQNVFFFFRTPAVLNSLQCCSYFLLLCTTCVLLLRASLSVHSSFTFLLLPLTLGLLSELVYAPGPRHWLASMKWCN